MMRGGTGAPPRVKPAGAVRHVTPGPRPGPGGPVRLTGRGAVVLLFAGCFLGLLLSAGTGWTALGDAVFVMGSGLIAYHTRASGLRYVVVCPPLVFFAACVCCQALLSAGGFAFLEGVLVTLGLAAPWLFTGTALAGVIAFGRGFRPSWLRVLRDWLREFWGPRRGLAGRGA